MGCTHSKLLCRAEDDVLLDERTLPSQPTDFTLSQLPFFSEDRIDDHPMPPTPPSVCNACWCDGPFAIHFGLPYVSPLDGQLYRRWPNAISYSTSLAKMESRANAGCVWCRLLLPEARRVQSERNSSLNITVEGNAKKWDDWGQNYQGLGVKINGHDIFAGFVYTELGVSGKHRRSQAKDKDRANESQQMTLRPHTLSHEAPSAMYGLLAHWPSPDNISTRASTDMIAANAHYPLVALASPRDSWTVPILHFHGWLRRPVHTATTSRSATCGAGTRPTKPRHRTYPRTNKVSPPPFCQPPSATPSTSRTCLVSGGCGSTAFV